MTNCEIKNILCNDMEVWSFHCFFYSEIFQPRRKKGGGGLDETTVSDNSFVTTASSLRSRKAGEASSDVDPQAGFQQQQGSHSGEGGSELQYGASGGVYKGSSSSVEPGEDAAGLLDSELREFLPPTCLRFSKTASPSSRN